MNCFFRTLLGGSLLFLSCQLSAQITSQRSVMMPIIRTNQTFETLDMEVPMRCGENAGLDETISSSIVLKKSDFKILMQEDQDEIPQINVDEFSFTSVPAHQAVSLLVKDTGIKVKTKEKYFPKLSGQNVSGSLDFVLRSLGQSGGFFYAYESDTQTLKLFKQGHFEIYVPQNKNVMLAVIDAIRGAGIEEITPDWQSSTLLLTATRDEIEKVKKVLRYFQKGNPILVMQARIFHLNPKFKDITWRTVLNQMGINRVRSSDRGISGQLITLRHSNPRKLLQSMDGLYDVTPLAQGVVVIPDQWKARFDIGKCTSDLNLSSGLSVLFSANVLPKEQILTTLTLDSLAGEVSSYRSITQLDDELVLMGLPAVLMNPSMSGDLMIVFNVRFIRFN